MTVSHRANGPLSYRAFLGPSGRRGVLPHATTWCRTFSSDSERAVILSHPVWSGMDLFVYTQSRQAYVGVIGCREVFWKLLVG